MSLERESGRGNVLAQIYLPGEKEKIWHRMRDDLKSLAPWFADYDLVVCPTCLRHITFEEFSLEHIIPQRALDDDHKTARDAVTRNRRAGLTLLCSKRLVIKGKLIVEKGCNSWKWKHFDRFIGQILQSHPYRAGFTPRHRVAMFTLGYLALFRKYGYRKPLSRSGLFMRNQFFNPNNFLEGIPDKCQMIVMGPPLSEFDDNIKSYWDEPFRISISEGFAMVSVRNVAFSLPLSDDPTTPSRQGPAVRAAASQISPGFHKRVLTQAQAPRHG
jgi:hypothetical protein